MSDEQKEAVRTAGQTVCKKCKSPLVNIATGSVCPRGHEGLYPAVKAKEHATAVRTIRLDKLPQATRVSGIVCRPRQPGQVTSLLYTLSDRPGVWHRVKRISSSFSINSDNTVLAHETTTKEAVELVRASAVENYLGIGDLIDVIAIAAVKLADTPSHNTPGEFDTEDVAEICKAVDAAHELLVSELDPLGKLDVPTR